MTGRLGSAVSLREVLSRLIALKRWQREETNASAMLTMLPDDPDSIAAHRAATERIIDAHYALDAVSLPDLHALMSDLDTGAAAAPVPAIPEGAAAALSDLWAFAHSLPEPLGDQVRLHVRRVRRAFTEALP